MEVTSEKNKTNQSLTANLVEQFGYALDRTQELINQFDAKIYALHHDAPGEDKDDIDKMLQKEPETFMDHMSEHLKRLNKSNTSFENLQKKLNEIV